MMSIQSDKDQRSTPLALRYLRVVFRKPNHRSDSTAVIAGRVKPAVAVGNDVDGFIRRTRQRAPNESCLQILNSPDIQPNLDMWGLSCRSLGNQISRRIPVITPDREGWGLGTGWIRLISQMAGQHVYFKNHGSALGVSSLGSAFRLQPQHVESKNCLAANVLAGEVGFTPQAGVHGFNIQSLLRCACRSVIRLRRIEM